MRRPITLALVVLSGLAVPARAGSLSGTFDGDSTLTLTGSPGIYVQNFTGDGDDVTYGSFTPQSLSTIDFSNPPRILISDGMLLMTFSQGTLFGTGSGSGTGSGHGTATFTVDFSITGGTGLFAGAMGDVTLTGMITQTSPTTESINDGSYVGSFSVPEPSTLTLFAPACAVGAVVLVRQRRSPKGRLADWPRALDAAAGSR
jgi:hypothetical protein